MSTLSRHSISGYIINHTVCWLHWDEDWGTDAGSTQVPLRFQPASCPWEPIQLLAATYSAGPQQPALRVPRGSWTTGWWSRQKYWPSLSFVSLKNQPCVPSCHQGNWTRSSHNRISLAASSPPGRDILAGTCLRASLSLYSAAVFTFCFDLELKRISSAVDRNSVFLLLCFYCVKEKCSWHLLC